MVKKEEGLSEEDRRALRGSKFAPLPCLPSCSQQRQQPRLAHPGGPLTTNKAAALAKFLGRKLQEPNGLANINPDLLELAVNNAKHTVASGTSTSGRNIRHVSSFGDSEEEEVKGKMENAEPKKPRKKKKKKSKEKVMKDPGCATLKKTKKKMKL